MNVGSGEKDLDARVRGPLQSLPGAVDIALAGASQARNNGPPHRGGNTLDGLKITIRGDRKPGLDHVDAQTVQLLSEAEFFLHVHAASRRLFAVPQSSIENSNARPIH